MNLRRCLALLSLAWLIAACGAGKAAGESCSLDAAEDCESGICAEVTCTSDNRHVVVCAGEKCTDEGSCPSGQSCVTDGSAGACVPVSVCPAGSS
jgi:hypothetical protein